MRTTRFIAFPDQDDWHIGETEFYKRQSRHRAKPSRSRTRLQGPPRCRRKQILNTLHDLGGTLLVSRELHPFNQIIHAGRVIRLRKPMGYWVERSTTIDVKPLIQHEASTWTAAKLTIPSEKRSWHESRVISIKLRLRWHQSMSFAKQCLNKKTNSWRLKGYKATQKPQLLRVDLLHRSRKASTWSIGGIQGIIGLTKARQFLQYGQKPAIHLTVSQCFCKISLVSLIKRPWPQKFVTGLS